MDKEDKLLRTFKIEAKKTLKIYRAEGKEVKLKEVYELMARKHGFNCWPVMKHRILQLSEQIGDFDLVKWLNENEKDEAQR